MSPFPNQTMNDSPRASKVEYFNQPGEDYLAPAAAAKNMQFFPPSPQDTSSSIRTPSDDSSDQVIDQGQYSDLNTHKWEEGGVSVFDGIELPVITDANLYIKNIDYDISDDTLYSVFSQLGEITSHHIIRDATKRSRGFGFM
jgi:RNA recognition motif. (a.k.a. RRM, RBD, or RNP domain)